MYHPISQVLWQVHVEPETILLSKVYKTFLKTSPQ